MDLINTLTKARLDRLRPRPLSVEFTFSDLPGPISLGTVPATHVINKTIVEVQEAFDGGVQITVGDVVGQARLQTIVDNKPTVVNHYEVNNSYEYDTDTEIFVFFPAGTPTTGRAKIIVYLD